MSGEKKPSAALLITQCIVTAVFLATVGILRLLGGTVYEEWKSGWQYLTEDNVFVDIGTQWLVGEMDGESEEVTP